MRQFTFAVESSSGEHFTNHPSVLPDALTILQSPIFPTRSSKLSYSWCVQKNDSNEPLSAEEASVHLWKEHSGLGQGRASMRVTANSNYDDLPWEGSPGMNTLQHIEQEGDKHNAVFARSRLTPGRLLQREVLRGASSSHTSSPRGYIGLLQYIPTAIPQDNISIMGYLAGGGMPRDALCMCSLPCNRYEALPVAFAAVTGEKHRGCKPKTLQLFPAQQRSMILQRQLKPMKARRVTDVLKSDKYEFLALLKLEKAIYSGKAQNSSCDKDVLLNILSVLTDLLSLGTGRRIQYVISKGGSEALLQALISAARTEPPDHSILLPLLRLLARVGQRDRKFGLKVQKAEATDVILSLTRQNLGHHLNLTHCLWVLRVCASNGTTLGINGAMELLFKVITPYSKRHIRTVRAAIEALAALLKSKSNSRRAVNRGYLGGLLRLYQDWHQNDISNNYIYIRRGLLLCLKHITNIQLGRETFLGSRGMEILFTSVQDCLSCKNLDPIVTTVTQILRKCYPKEPLPVVSVRSSYSFPLPGNVKTESPCVGFEDDYESDGEEEVEKDLDKGDVESKEEDYDLETDVNKLRSRPVLDRPEEELGQYEAMCLELFHNFQELQSESEEDKSLEDRTENLPSTPSSFVPSDNSVKHPNYRWRNQSASEAGPDPGEKNFKVPLQSWTNKEKCRRDIIDEERDIEAIQNTDSREEENPAKSHVFTLRPLPKEAAWYKKTFNPESEASTDSSPGEKLETSDTVTNLLEEHQENIPFHNPHFYVARAKCIKSIPAYKDLAFPDFWGHQPPPCGKPMLERQYGVQRDKVLDDVRRLIQPCDVIGRTVYDLDEPSHSSPGAPGCLTFFSKFESGNLRKAIQVREFEYDLIMNADVNSNQHHQWFYFEVRDMKLAVPYRFNIINCEKFNSQFNYGMQLVMYSVKEALLGRPCWLRVGHDISYYKNHYRCRAAAGGGMRGRYYYTLTFSIKFPHKDDVCYLAYHYPYTYSTMMAHLDILEQNRNPKKVYWRKQTLCQTLGGNPCPLLTITAMPESKKSDDLEQFRKVTLCKFGLPYYVQNFASEDYSSSQNYLKYRTKTAFCKLPHNNVAAHCNALNGFDKSSKGPLGTTISTYLKTVTEEKKKKKGGRLRGQKVLKYIIGAENCDHIPSVAEKQCILTW
ncbi:Cytosolic carboxypeptidase 4 [Aix galericulata]|nr:Cytosolic carboxypeptidase 4 [Aix galericulata]